MADNDSKKDDLKITDLPAKTPETDGDDAKVKGGMPPRGGGGHMTFTGEEVDQATGS